MMLLSGGVYFEKKKHVNITLVYIFASVFQCEIVLQTNIVQIIKSNEQ